jgi:hypothetical protein
VTWRASPNGLAEAKWRLFALAGVRPAEAGLASGLFNTTQQIGGAPARSTRGASSRSRTGSATLPPSPTATAPQLTSGRNYAPAHHFPQSAAAKAPGNSPLWCERCGKVSVRVPGGEGGCFLRPRGSTRSELSRPNGCRVSPIPPLRNAFLPQESLLRIGTKAPLHDAFATRGAGPRTDSILPTPCRRSARGGGAWGSV